MFKKFFFTYHFYSKHYVDNNFDKFKIYSLTLTYDYMTRNSKGVIYSLGAPTLPNLVTI